MLFQVTFVAMTEYFKIGHIAGTHGIHGQMVLRHSLGTGTDWNEVRAVFLEEEKDSFVPWFITGISPKNQQEVLVMFEDVSTKEQAGLLLRKDVWLSKKDFMKLASKDSPISWLGFTIYNGKERVGDIEEIIEQPHQILCRVIWEKKELLIPIHEDSLKKIDRKGRKLIVELPEGLLEIYKQG